MFDLFVSLLYFSFDLEKSKMLPRYLKVGNTCFSYSLASFSLVCAFFLLQEQVAGGIFAHVMIKISWESFRHQSGKRPSGNTRTWYRPLNYNISLNIWRYAKHRVSKIPRSAYKNVRQGETQMVVPSVSSTARKPNLHFTDIIKKFRSKVRRSVILKLKMIRRRLQ